MRTGNLRRLAVWRRMGGGRLWTLHGLPSPPPGGGGISAELVAAPKLRRPCSPPHPPYQWHCSCYLFSTGSHGACTHLSRCLIYVRHAWRRGWATAVLPSWAAKEALLIARPGACLPLHASYGRVSGSLSLGEAEESSPPLQAGSCRAASPPCMLLLQPQAPGSLIGRTSHSSAMLSDGPRMPA